jgi:hypothetical protein
MTSAERTTLMTTATSTPLANPANWEMTYDFFERSRTLRLRSAPLDGASLSKRLLGL